MKELLLLHLLVISVIAGPFQPPNEWQDADAAWLSNKIYDGVNTMNTDSGYVFHSHDSRVLGAYAIWKQIKSGECYIVIRGTKTLSDVFVDLDVEEYYDDEIGVRVHNGVRKRTNLIFGEIDDKLTICTEDIIITGHSLGGSIAYYLYLKYVYYHIFNWGQRVKASRFKAVLFGAPALTTKSDNGFLTTFDDYINWYKYGSDPVPFIISKVKGSVLFEILSNLFSSLGITITKKAYNIIQTVNYGSYHPGKRYHLINGEKIDYLFDYSRFDSIGIRDHMELYRAVEILTKIW